MAVKLGKGNLGAGKWEISCFGISANSLLMSDLKWQSLNFGLSMLMLILLNHDMFIKVIRCLHDIKWFGSQQNVF